MNRLAATVAPLIALLALSACWTVQCEQATWDRVVSATLTFGLHEIDRLDCPSDEELADLKERARSGNPNAQLSLGSYYRHHVSYWSEYSESAYRTGAALLRCAAEGGSTIAQGHTFLDDYLDEPEASKIMYKFARISAERLECDCNAFNSIFGYDSENCYVQCRNIEDAEENLDSIQIEQLDKEIAAYEPTPMICEVEIVAE